VHPATAHARAAEERAMEVRDNRMGILDLGGVWSSAIGRASMQNAPRIVAASRAQILGTFPI